jgi:hypothetical protein
MWGNKGRDLSAHQNLEKDLHLRRSGEPEAAQKQGVSGLSG